jgi:hypothetical protein
MPAAALQSHRASLALHLESIVDPRNAEAAVTAGTELLNRIAGASGSPSCPIACWRASFRCCVGPGPIRDLLMALEDRPFKLASGRASGYGRYVKFLTLIDLRNLQNWRSQRATPRTWV